MSRRELMDASIDWQRLADHRGIFARAFVRVIRWGEGCELQIT